MEKDLLKESRLNKFNYNKKKSLQYDIEQVKHDMMMAYSNFSSLVMVEDIEEVISLSRNVGKSFEKLSSAYYGLIFIQKEVGLITNEEWETLHKNIKYGNMYSYSKCLLDGDYVEELLRLVDEREFIPPIGSEEYCRWQGYYDLSRVEMGRIIKVYLMERFPESKFSVTTERSNWWHKDKVEVRISSNDGLTRECVEEVLKKYKPRVILSVHY